MDEENMTKSEEQQPLSLQKALQQCELVQNMIDLSISNLEGLRTKCATSNDLTQKEIRTLESKLVKYFSRQLSCKKKVALQERNAELDGFPQLRHWFRIVDVRKEVLEEITPGQLSLEDLLEMTDEQVCETVEKYGANREECARLNASLSCLRNVHMSGGNLSKQDWTIQWPTTETGKENNPVCPPEPTPWIRTHLSQSPRVQTKCVQHYCHASPSPGAPVYTHMDRLTVDAYPGLCPPPPLESGHRSLPPSPRQRHAVRTPPRTPNIVTTVTPPGTPPMRRKNKLKPPGTPPPSSRKLIHLIPGFTALHRSKSHEFQLGHRVDEVHTPKAKKKSKPLNLKIHSSVGSCENIPSQQRSPLLSERSLRSFFVGHAPFLPSTPPVHTEANFSANTLSVPRWSPQIPRRDLGNSIKHRFSTKYWMSQTCTVCGKGMLFGLKCKNCKLKCHNKCTKEAPPCHLLIIHRGARLVRTESVPCDINNPLRKPPRYSDLHISQTLPKTNKISKDHIPVPYQPDSSSNPSSTTSSTPSSPAPPLPPSATPPSPLHPSPQCMRQQKNFNLPASHYYKYKQQFIFPDVVPVPETPTRAPQVILHPVTSNPILEGNPLLQIEVEPTSENEEGHDEAEESEDEFEEMNLSLLSARSFPRKASQTSIFLQEWDIPFEQLEIGELIGKGRFGQVYHGRWHGEVAIRLIDIERDNEEQLKAFKREVMAYRQTRHENVVLFMGACMSPPHLAIITSLCKGRTLYSVVRDAKIVLDVNKTRQIAQEIVKGMGYLHAKGILHKDLKSKNVFYDNGKVVITDFGLFSISGVLQAGRREDKLRIQNGWLCHLAPEIIRQLSPDTEEDKLPFSKHSDVFALGTIWYELHAREWPFKTQPAEAIIWQMGTGMKPNLSQIGMGKEISDILLFCWAFEQEERPTFTKLMDMLEKLPKRNRRLSHPGHFWKSAEL
ncbi:kinase suppressor of Ras 2 isoform X3 [Canis lupus baileyi]|uniref:kinase suppressor of Ras 2 isoform X1 n=3 Tax=Canis lupus dingo TaxID=286419 RepID=UPI0006B3D4B3|nr:kinase suppressor of Ras 2 isoform X1 [Canis lupus dingo]XP_038292783.1 kinase suppressor of Ras 2 isoform X3 [Canis lupus familiaris]XP_038315272.1 kinase suppressor of Ras 2 isoform X3 [Canis lupus familiaris]XP_038431178.1 kinase suppressor of Ras 2 isoform X3 [Canis lupus familiaris]XP_048957998.1 kinase suppressor of Ras 2 isoform X1 [Canis lupus dingo]XP_048957999.1 kinase suppressor of Ras 2 isoform X1 [Canis lupus dingo]XP_048958000.1 kinase suppressor of Ras 2 isoform X1 [Canis lu|eukprot:XP_005636335.2 kinase suppressor of Ras 2 isoform X3 [Canis lupus familiaris]